MRRQAKQLVLRGIDVALSRHGYAGTDLDLAREEVVEWGKLRVHARRGGIAGLRVAVTRPGRAELLPYEAAPPRDGEVTVEMLVSAVSPGTERAQWLRLPNAQPRLPFRPGYSGVGRILLSGQPNLAPGRIVAVPRAQHASVVTVPASWVIPVPSDVPLEQAALLYLAIISGYGVRRAGVSDGVPVGVFGAGPIGALAHRLAQLKGAGPVTVVARSGHREQASRAAGAADFRLVSDGVRDLDLPVVIDASGDASSITAAVAATADAGTTVLLGSPRGRSERVPLAEVQQRGLRLVGAHVSALATEVKRTGVDVFSELGRTFLDGLAAHRLDAADLAGDPVDPREIGLFYRRLGAGEVSTGHLDWRLMPAEERVTTRRLLAGPVVHPIRRVLPGRPVEGAVAARARPLRFAAVGCGDIGATNARSIARASNADLVLLHDAVPGLAEAAAASYGGKPVPAAAMAFDPSVVDAVFLSVPHDLHEALALQAIAAGLHVVVEKPLAVDLPAARRIAEAADQAGVTLSVCFPYRYEPATVAASRLVHDGALGTLRGATVLFHADKPSAYWLGGFSGRAASGWRSERARSGGGVTIMNLTHYVDLMRYVTGCEFTVARATARHAPGAEVEDAVSATLTFDADALCTFAGSASTPGKPPTRFEMWGDLGTLQLEPEPRLYTGRALPEMLLDRWNDLPTTPTVDERTTFVERFAAAVLSGRTPDVTAADGLAVQAVVDAVYRSADAGGAAMTLSGTGPRA